MRLSVKSVRWLLVTGAVLLLVVLAGYISYGRYRALRKLKEIQAKLGISITHDTENFTYSQSVQGRTVFTLRAAKAVPHGNGQYSLHNAVLTLYGRVEGSVDTIYGEDFEYDDNDKVAKAIGDVHIDLQAPHALSVAGRAPEKPGDPPLPSRPDEAGHEGTDVIHIRTSGLVYLRKLGVAATDQPVEMHYGKIQCTSRGAEFNSGESKVHLLADVHMTGEVRGAPINMTATAADLDRTANVADFTMPIVQTQGRTARADHAVTNFRKDGSMEAATATGHVVLSAGTQQVNAARLDGTFGESSLPRTAKLSGGVTMVDTTTLRPSHGSAALVDAAFDAHGSPSRVVASGGANFAMLDHRAANSKGLRRELSGDTITATLTPGARKSDARLTEIHVIGAAKAVGDSVATEPKGTAKASPQTKSTQIAADDLRALFGSGHTGKTELQHLLGNGHTVLQQDAPLGAQQISAGDTLDVVFGKTTEAENFRISSATQTGHVSIRSRSAAKPASSKSANQTVTTAAADRAVYDGSAERLTLTGGAHVSDGSTTLTATNVSLDQKTGDATAQGSVAATLQGSLTGETANADKASAQITHVTAASARIQHDSHLAEFHGTDAQPARLWQGASQVEAANLFFDNDKRSLSARPVASTAAVHAVFATEPSARKPQRKSGAMNLIRVSSQRMDYSDQRREAVFAGEVAIDGTAGDVRAQRAVVLLNPATKPAPKAVEETSPNPFSGSIDKVVITGDVRMDQPDRHGTGEQLVYNAAADSYVLTGTAEKQPKIVDAKQGTVSGSTLLFSDSGSTIVVVGSTGTAKPGEAAKPRVRVRTETDGKR